MQHNNLRNSEILLGLKKGFDFCHLDGKPLELFKKLCRGCLPQGPIPSLTLAPSLAQLVGFNPDLNSLAKSLTIRESPTTFSGEIND
jgi:hypothetical protein